jgi:hypothetical protein
MEHPNYFATIPAHVRYAKISASAKLLYAEITALSNKHGYCWATNKYFAELYDVSETTVSEWVRVLCEVGFIASHVDQQNGNKRKLWLLNPIQENPKTPLRENPKTSSGKPKDPSSGKPEDNNTRYNNKYNNTPPTPQRGELDVWQNLLTQNMKGNGNAKRYRANRNNGGGGKISYIVNAILAEGKK